MEEGVHFGRPEVELPDNFEPTIAECRKGNITAVEAIRRTGLSKTTIIGV